MYRCNNSNNHCENKYIQSKECNKINRNKQDDRCECGFENDPTIFPENYMYGQSYVPIQYIDKIFKPDVGLKMGTIFPELVSPYSAGDSMKEDMYLRRATENIVNINNV